MSNTNLETKFEEIYQDLAKAIFRFAYLKVSNYELAQDLTSETFLKFWKRFSSDQEVRNPKALLYFIANGLIIDYYRKGESKKKTQLDKIDERLLSSATNPERNLEDKEELDSVFRALQKIKKEYQEIILFHYVEDLSISEIAEITEKKENSLRVLLHRALKALKEKL